MKRPRINEAVRRVLARVKTQIAEDPELAKVPLQKLTLVVCEELDINPAIAVFIANEVAKRRNSDERSTED